MSVSEFLSKRNSRKPGTVNSLSGIFLDSHVSVKARTWNCDEDIKSCNCDILLRMLQMLSRPTVSQCDAVADPSEGSSRRSLET